MSSATLMSGWATAATPPPRFTVSQWADARRRLPDTSGARGGQWHTDATPYLRGIMDSVHEPGVNRIAVRKCHQVGGSEALHNIVGYHIDYDPCAILFVHPTVLVAQEWSKERLSDMIRSTPSLRSVVREGRQSKESGESESTLQLKMFPGGFLALGGANTPNTFARRAVRIAIGDDVDRFPPVVGDEGDPADLLVNRTTSFYDALTLFVSTPTLKGGRIDTLYQRSDQRQYFVTCPGCHREDWVTWNDPTHFRVTWDGHQAETARIECPDDDHGGCGAHITEIDRHELVAHGPGWRPTAKSQDAGLVGFHLPAMLSTIGSVGLPTLVEKWLSARARGKESLRVFINTWLAEGWEDRGARMNSHALANRKEAYDERPDVEVPARAVALTAGVDVQDNRFELQVFAWGIAGERWVVDWRSVPGNPKEPETRAALWDALQRRYKHASGHQLPIHATCIDSGYATEDVYDFVLAHEARKVYATKGYGGRSGEPIVGKPSEKRYGRSPRPVRLYPINVDDAKGDLMGSLALPNPGPGYVHFPTHLESIDEEYFAQLCAEHKETRYNKAGVATHVVWVQDRDRNEALDTAVLALAAYKLLNPNIAQMLALLAHIEHRAERSPTQSNPAPAHSTPERSRRSTRSRYLS